MAFGPKSKKRRAFVQRQLTVIAQGYGYVSTQAFADDATDSLRHGDAEATSFGLLSILKTEPVRRAFFSRVGAF